MCSQTCMILYKRKLERECCDGRGRECWGRAGHRGTCVLVGSLPGPPVSISHIHNTFLNKLAHKPINRYIQSRRENRKTVKQKYKIDINTISIRGLKMLISNLIQIIVINFPDRLRAARGCLFLWFTEFTKLSELNIPTLVMWSRVGEKKRGPTSA